jgi:hypothetical protein
MPSGADVTYCGLVQLAGDGAAGWVLPVPPDPELAVLPVVPVAGWVAVPGELPAGRATCLPPECPVPGMAAV